MTTGESERIFAAAIDHFATNGYDNADLDQIAGDADSDLATLFAHFPRKQAFVAHLYEQLATDLETRVAELPDGSVAERFVPILAGKLDDVDKHADLLGHLLPSLLSPNDRLGAFGPHANRVRSRVLGVCELVVRGSQDCPDDEAAIERLSRVLYAVQLAAIFLVLQRPADEREIGTDIIDLAKEVVRVAQRFAALGVGPERLLTFLGVDDHDAVAASVDNVLGNVLFPPSDRIHFSAAENVLRDLFRFRRLQPGAANCAIEACRSCLALHLPLVEAAMANGEPIVFVLPAFPAKSPNPNKVLGRRPDLAEELALRFLQQRCDAVAEIYEPGARVVICSDGRVFGDVVGVSDDDISDYRQCLIEKIEELGLSAIEMFDLDDVVETEDYDGLRTWLLDNYAESTEALRERTKQHDSAKQMFNGIHRFMFEDLAQRSPDLSRSQARKQSKDLAYEVIRRSNAWSRLVAGRFPEGVRLSIHPQPAHGDKVGIMLADADDPWLTPWHGVALLRASNYTLVHRAHAVEIGAELIQRDGVASHYELLEDRGAQRSDG